MALASDDSTKMQLTCHQWSKFFLAVTRRLWNVNLTKWIYDAFKRKSLEHEKRIGKNSTLNLKFVFPSFHGNINFFYILIRINFLWDVKFNFNEKRIEFSTEKFTLAAWLMRKNSLFIFTQAFRSCRRLWSSQREFFFLQLFTLVLNHSNVVQLRPDNFFSLAAFRLRFKFNSIVSTTFFPSPLEDRLKFFIIFCHFKMLNFSFIFSVVLLDFSQLNHFEWKHKGKRFLFLR